MDGRTDDIASPWAPCRSQKEKGEFSFSGSPYEKNVKELCHVSCFCISFSLPLSKVLPDIVPWEDEDDDEVADGGEEHQHRHHVAKQRLDEVDWTKEGGRIDNVAGRREGTTSHYHYCRFRLIIEMTFSSLRKQLLQFNMSCLCII